MKATDAKGVLQQITGCSISIPTANGQYLLIPRILPEITDSKSASYTDEIVIGRSTPIKTYSHSDNRVFSIKWKFLLVDDVTKNEAINGLKAIQSCVYPYNSTAKSAPYGPPAICTLTFGRLFATGNTKSACAILKRYSVSYPTDVAWDGDDNAQAPATFLPYKFDVDMEWEVVYASVNLPGREKIIE